MSITIFNISSSFCSALANAYHAFSELSTKLRSYSLSSSASGVPDIFIIISESSAESQRLTHAHVRKRCKKVAKFSRSRNSGTVEGINIPIVMDGAGAFSMGAAAAGAVARSLRSTYSLSLANSSSVEFAFPPFSSFRDSLLYSSIFC